MNLICTIKKIYILGTLLFVFMMCPHCYKTNYMGIGTMNSVHLFCESDSGLCMYFTSPKYNFHFLRSIKIFI